MSVPRRGEGVRTAVAAGVILLLGVLVAWPLGRILTWSLTGPDGLTLDHLRASLGAGRLPRILVDSVAVAAASTAVTVGLALVVAHAVARTDVPGRRLVAGMSALPFLSPPFVAPLALLLLLGPRGLVTGALGIEGSILGVHGIVVAQALTFVLHASRRIAGGLGTIDRVLEEAGESLGAGRVTILRRIVWPLARPGLASTALVVFVLCLGDLANPLLVGGGHPLLATEIYARVAGANDLASAAVLGVALAVPCLLAHAANVACVGARPGAALAAPAPAALRPASAALRWCSGVPALAVALAVALAHAAVPVASVVQRWGVDWSPSLQHYAVAATGQGARAVWTSVALAAASATAGTALALVTAVLVERRRTPGARATEALGLLPAALPGGVIGVGYLLAFGGAPLAPAGPFVVLVASVVVWKLPAALLAGITALRRIDPAVEEAAASLGAGRLHTAVRVLLPLLRGPALSIVAYYFASGMVTVGAVIFLVYPGVTPASVAILAQVEHGEPGTACALGTLLQAIVALAVLGLRRFAGRDRVPVLPL